MADLKEMIKALHPVKFQLGRDTELEEIYEKMNENSSDFQMSFKLKKSIFGKRIEFNKEKDLDLIIRVTVKDREVTVRPIVQETRTTVGTGNINFRVDKKSAFNQGISGVLNLPAERAAYFENTVETIRNILT